MADPPGNRRRFLDADTVAETVDQSQLEVSQPEVTTPDAWLSAGALVTEETAFDQPLDLLPEVDEGTAPSARPLVTQEHFIGDAMMELEADEEDELPPARARNWLKSFTGQVVLPDEEEPEEAFDWSDRLAELGLALARTDDTDRRTELLLEMGQINWDKLDDRPAAARAFEQVLELSPANAEAFDALENIYYVEWETEKLAELLIDRAGQEARPERQAELLGRVAEIYLQLNQPDHAVIALEAAVRADPTDAAAADKLAELTQPPEPTQQRDELDLLREQLAQVRETADRIDLLERMAAIHQQRGEPQGMVEALQQVLALDPRRLVCYRQLEQAFQQAGELDQLVQTLERHAEVAPPGERPAITHRLARLYHEALGDAPRACKAYRALLALEPAHGQALTALARLSEELGQWRDAVGALEQLVALERTAPARADLHLRLAEIQLQVLGSTEQGESHLLQAVQAVPSHRKALAQLTEIYRGRGDWGKVVRLLQDAAEHSPSQVERARLLFNAGMAALEGLEDEQRAAELLQRALESDPDHVDAAQPLSEILWHQKRHRDNLPVLELVLRKSPPADRGALGQLHLRLAHAAQAAAEEPRARRHLEQALQHNPQLVQPRRMLMEVDLRERRFLSALDHARQLLGQRDELQPAEVARALAVVGYCLKERGDGVQATQALEQSLALNPEVASTRDLLLELYEQQERWRDLLQLDATRLSQLEGEEKAALLLRLAQISGDRCRDPAQAEQWLRQGLQVDPDHHGLLHALIELYAEQGQWGRMVEVCDHMAQVESRPELKAKYFGAIAVVQRDRLQQPMRAREYYERVLDCDPTALGAFEAIDRLCTKARAWKELEQSYARMIKRLPAAADNRLRVMLWDNLGEILRTRRRNFEDAVHAFEAAMRLDPGNLERMRILSELYLGLGGEQVERAIGLHTELMAREPGVAEHEQRLQRLYLQAGRYDAAWCLAMVLVHRGAADRETESFYRQYRRKRPAQASGPLSSDLWQRLLRHPEQDLVLSTLFGQLAAPLAPLSARAASSFGLRPAERRDPARRDLPCLGVFDYAVSVLAVPPPVLYLRPDRMETLLMAHTQGAPSFVVGRPVLQASSHLELAFLIAKQLTYLRPEHVLRSALPSRGQLLALLLALLTHFRQPVELSAAQRKAVDPLLGRLKRALQPGLREQVATQVSQLLQRGGVSEELVTRWWNALDLTSDRAGLLLCGDLETAAKALQADARGSEVDPRLRLEQLLRFAGSRAYIELRRELGLTIDQ